VLTARANEPRYTRRLRRRQRFRASARARRCSNYPGRKAIYQWLNFSRGDEEYIELSQRYAPAMSITDFARSYRTYLRQTQAVIYTESRACTQACANMDPTSKGITVEQTSACGAPAWYQTFTETFQGVTLKGEQVMLDSKTCPNRRKHAQHSTRSARLTRRRRKPRGLEYESTSDEFFARYVILIAAGKMSMTQS
jgi:hypothetical protein